MEMKVTSKRLRVINKVKVHTQQGVWPDSRLSSSSLYVTWRHRGCCFEGSFPGKGRELQEFGDWSFWEVWSVMTSGAWGKWGSGSYGDFFKLIIAFSALWGFHQHQFLCWRSKALYFIEKLLPTYFVYVTWWWYILLCRYFWFLYITDVFCGICSWNFL